MIEDQMREEEAEEAEDQKRQDTEDTYAGHVREWAFAVPWRVLARLSVLRPAGAGV